MASAPEPNIPSASADDHAATPVPTRAELDAVDRRYLTRGSRTKADLFEVEIGGRSVVVKDFAAKPWWIRWWGRLQTGRECRAYAALGDSEGFASLVGRIDPWALALERIRGSRLAFAADRFSRGPRHVTRLRETVDRMHAHGVVHLDLRGRENVLVRDDGRIVILDLAGALVLRPGSILHRVLFRFLAVLDESAFLKWKLLLDPDGLTSGERRFLERYRRFVRPLWPINRKRPGPEEGSA
jgi:hypothetical protein